MHDYNMGSLTSFMAFNVVRTYFELIRHQEIREFCLQNVWASQELANEYFRLKRERSEASE